MYKFFTKTATLFIFFVFTLLAAWGSYMSVEYKELEPDIHTALKKKATVDYLDTKILDAISIENFDDVLMYQNLADFLDLRLSPSTLKRIEEENGFLNKSWRDAKAFSAGFVNGESESMAGMSGCIASDMTLYGDLRDLKKEGTKYVNNEEYDKFILQISLIGIGLSTSQLLSLGTSTPLKMGASMIKIAKKSGKFSKTFTQVVSDKLSKTVDMKMLNTFKFNSHFTFKSAQKTLLKSLDFSHVKVLFKDINTIKNNTSLSDTVSLMKYVDSAKDLKSIGKLSTKFTANTKAVMSILGKSALRGTKTVLKYSSRFIGYMIGLFFSVMGFLIGLLTKIFFWIRIIQDR